MSGRNRVPPHPISGAPHYGLPPMHEPTFVRGLGPMPHPALLEEMREAQFGRGPRPLPPHPAIIEERLAAQHQEIQGLLIDNQRLAATHVALKQELAAAQHELQRMAHLGGSMQQEKDIQLREAFEKSMKMEADLCAAEAMRAELLQVRADIQKLTAARQELTSQVQALTQDLDRANSELQQTPVLKAEIEHMKQELQRARAAIEYEKKGHAENYEQGQAMEKNLIAMAREVEKLRAEIANAEKRARAAAAVVGNPGPGYGGNYSNSDTSYGGNPYPAGYGMSPVQAGAEGGHRYGPGPQSQYGQGPGAWGAYDMQRSHGRR
ncbi:protein FLX-like 1 [Telopea speciosissima]|uniref:protein FLX-like 1 n=1 Tax=Telopea speciosissima TaxID=54955 RepID=UPI001CC623D3|nr:protein FLX-like 1 [Telopea speciosissima]